MRKAKIIGLYIYILLNTYTNEHISITFDSIYMYYTFALYILIKTLMQTTFILYRAFIALAVQRKNKPIYCFHGCPKRFFSGKWGAARFDHNQL